MWRRLMRRTMAPRRPPAFMEQWPITLVSIVALGAGIWLALRAAGV